MPKQWLISSSNDDCDVLSLSCKVPHVIAQLLLNRGLNAADPVNQFLQPQLKDLHPPNLLPGASQAAEIITHAIRQRSRIVLYGDYDVDGTTGVAILWHLLHQAGADVSFYVPHRVEEGYGLNLEAVKRLLAEGTKLIVSVDCGITAAEVANAVRVAGAQLIITDHHASQGALPDAAAIVHPTVGGQYPNPHLCGAGVAFKLAWAIAQQLSGSDRVAPPFRELLLDLLPLAALGTIADVVPLVGENRVIAKHGLQALAKTKSPGLRALMESSGLDAGSVSGYDVGFKLAPRINAAGRMGHARLAVELLTRADESRAREIALYLEDHNRARQSTERRIAKDAFELIDKNRLAGDSRRAIVLASEGWHAGVIGIVASRVVERYHRPAVVISLSNGEGQGSGRSIKHFALNEALAACGEHLLGFGGHAMAAGLRIDSQRVSAFTEAFVAFANDRLTGDDMVPKLRLDCEVSLSDLTVPTVEAISALGPFGQGNPRPKLASGWLELVDEPRLVGNGRQHLQCTFREIVPLTKGDHRGSSDLPPCQEGIEGGHGVPLFEANDGVSRSSPNSVFSSVGALPTSASVFPPYQGGTEGGYSEPRPSGSGNDRPPLPRGDHRGGISSGATAEGSDASSVGALPSRASSIPPYQGGTEGGHSQTNVIIMKAIGFGLAGEIENLKQHRRCRVAFEPIINDFNGRRTAEMQIIDLQYPA